MATLITTCTSIFQAIKLTVHVFFVDKDRLILYDWLSGKLVTNLYGATNDEFSQPRHCWHPNGQYVYGVRGRGHG